MQDRNKEIKISNNNTDNSSKKDLSRVLAENGDKKRKERLQNLDGFRKILEERMDEILEKHPDKIQKLEDKDPQVIKADNITLLTNIANANKDAKESIDNPLKYLGYNQKNRKIGEK